MILVDTSVWIDHLARAHPLMTQFLAEGRVLTHPFVIGEIALGSLKDRTGLMDDLHDLRQLEVVAEPFVRQVLVERQMFARGIGYVDTHLLVSTLTTRGATIGTRDKNHLKEAERLGIAARLTN